MVKRITTLLLVAGVAAASAGTREIVLSSAMPGLGQLYGGGKTEKFVGLGFMAAEVVALHIYFNTLSQYNSLCQDTRNLKKELEVQTANNHDAMVIAQANWQKSHDDAVSKEKMLLPLLGVAAGIWVANVAQVVLFPSAKNQAPASPAEPQSGRTWDCKFALKDAQPHMFVQYNF
jgi:hypothetical protein